MYFLGAYATFILFSLTNPNHLVGHIPLQPIEKSYMFILWKLFNL